MEKSKLEELLKHYPGDPGYIQPSGTPPAQPETYFNAETGKRETSRPTTFSTTPDASQTPLVSRQGDNNFVGTSRQVGDNTVQEVSPGAFNVSQTPTKVSSTVPADIRDTDYTGQVGGGYEQQNVNTTPATSTNRTGTTAFTVNGKTVNIPNANAESLAAARANPAFQPVNAMEKGVTKMDLYKEAKLVQQILKQGMGGGAGSYSSTKPTPVSTANSVKRLSGQNRGTPKMAPGTQASSGMNEIGPTTGGVVGQTRPPGKTGRALASKRVASSGMTGGGFRGPQMKMMKEFEMAKAILKQGYGQGAGAYSGTKPTPVTTASSVQRLRDQGQEAGLNASKQGYISVDRNTGQVVGGGKPRGPISSGLESAADFTHRFGSSLARGADVLGNTAQGAWSGMKEGFQKPVPRGDAFNPMGYSWDDKMELSKMIKPSSNISFMNHKHGSY